MINNSLFTTGKDDWETPQGFFDNLNNEFNFTLDPCCTPKTAKCKKYYTPEDDGLSKSWQGETVFCNPPYSSGKQDKWIRKCHEEAQKPNTTVVALLPARTDTVRFHDYILGKAEIRFVRGRLKFGGSKNSAPFPSMIVIWRKSMRMIDADALIQKRNHAKAYAQDMYVIGQGYVMDAPTIDAAPVVRGEWDYTIKKVSCMDYHVTAKCSECGWDWFSKEGVGNYSAVFSAFITNGDSKPEEAKRFLLENARANNNLNYCPTCGAKMEDTP